MRTQNKGTRSSHSRITTIAIAVASSFAMTPAWAAPATNLPGNGVGIAIGSGSTAPKAENVAIGKDATIAYSGGVGQPSTGDIVIGGGATRTTISIRAAVLRSAQIRLWKIW